jgi:hypothetical protein
MTHLIAGTSGGRVRTGIVWATPVHRRHSSMRLRSPWLRVHDAAWIVLAVLILLLVVDSLRLAQLGGPATSCSPMDAMLTAEREGGQCASGAGWAFP